jgi:hypothetical protein
MFDLAELERLDRGLMSMAALRVELADRIDETQSLLSFGRLLPDQKAATETNVVRLIPKGRAHG